MRLSHKLKKILNSDAYESAKATLLRLSYPLDAKPFIDAIDRDAFNAIKERYFNPMTASRRKSISIWRIGCAQT